MSIIDNAIQSTLQKVAAPTRSPTSEGLAGVLAANQTKPTPYTEQGAMLAKQLEGLVNKQALERAHTPDYDQNVWLKNARYNEIAALADNLAMHSPAEYKEYFNKYEPDSKLNIPMVYKRAINR